MPRVLIPSDNRDFVRYLAQAYRDVGWEVAVGVGNFDLEAAEYDLVHLQWPEELCGWSPPGEERLAALVQRLEAWCARTRVVMTVHNIEPHRDGGNAMYRKLYTAFHERVPVQGHFTEASRESILRAYPGAAHARHVVTGYFNLDVLLPEHRDPAGARRRQGFAGDDFVLLVFGGLREWAEVQLIRQAFDLAGVPGKRLLMCGRYDEAGPRLRQKWRRWQWARWLRTRNSSVVSHYVPDEDVHKIVDAANAVLIPRFRSQNSGLPALGASFGKIVIAPRCGSYPELLACTQNPIYTPGNASDFARAIEEAARLDRTSVNTENRNLADRWQWKRLIFTQHPL
jgi:glycosyltransferase involved in cell wall biosynthesis